MVSKYFCDRCNEEIVAIDYARKFEIEFNTIGINKMPMLCPKCKIEFDKLIKDFVKTGKK